MKEEFMRQREAESMTTPNMDEAYFLENYNYQKEQEKQTKKPKQ